LAPPPVLQAAGQCGRGGRGDDLLLVSSDQRPQHEPPLGDDLADRALAVASAAAADQDQMQPGLAPAGGHAGRSDRSGNPSGRCGSQRERGSRTGDRPGRRRGPACGFAFGQRPPVFPSTGPRPRTFPGAPCCRTCPPPRSPRSRPRVRRTGGTRIRLRSPCAVDPTGATRSPWRTCGSHHRHLPGAGRSTEVERTFAVGRRGCAPVPVRERRGGMAFGDTRSGRSHTGRRGPGGRAQRGHHV
jgi:hypothetical protein